MKYTNANTIDVYLYRVARVVFPTKKTGACACSLNKMEVQSVVTFEAENLGMEVEDEQAAAPVFPPIRPSEVLVNFTCRY